MTLDAQRLYTLLPAVYRLRDEARGGPLRALLALLAEQLEAIEENVEQLYDDQFIETCADWVAPYIGDLIGYRPLHGVAPRIASPRAEVANTIAYRRRKGTALMLEQLARDVTDWPARAVEFFEQLATTQYMNHLRPHAPAAADLRDVGAMLSRGGAFNTVAHTAEVRRPESGAGRYNIPSIGIFLWRLQAFRLTRVPLVPDPLDASGRRFRVNPLGADMRLFRRPLTEPSIEHLALPLNVPAPLSVREMAIAVRAAQASAAPDAAIDDDYGDGESLLLVRPGATPADDVPLTVGALVVCDLRDVFDGGGAFAGWNHEASVAAGTVGIDPECGRVLLGSPADGPLLATFHYGFARPIGGGEYERTPSGDALALQVEAADSEALQPHLDAIASGGRLVIGDSLTYAETPTLRVDDVTAPNAPGLEVVVTAANPARPLIDASGPIALGIGARGRLVIEGIVIAGGALTLAAAADNEPRELILRDCTLVPGLELNPAGGAASPGAPSLVVAHPFAKVTLQRCITGALHVAADAELTMIDCIVDAGAASNVAYAADAAGTAGAEATIEQCTVVGKLHARALKLASNSIFFASLGDAPAETWPAPLRVQRRQTGCMRFSFVPRGSLTPRRHRCVPDASDPTARPHFTSLRYGDAGYAQLRAATSVAIRRGASDESEMGVMHDLFQPQRETNLRIRLDEYLRFGLRAGVFYAT